MSSPGSFLVPNPLQDVNREAIAKATQSSQAPSTKGGQVDRSGDLSGQMPPPSEDFMKLVQIAGKYYQTRKAIAGQKLTEMGNMARAGWMPDPKQMIKMVKQSGLHLDTTPEGIQTATQYFKDYYGEKDPVTGASRGEMPNEIKVMMEKANAGQLSKKDVFNFVAGGMVRNELRSARYAALDDQQKTALMHRGTKMQDVASDPTKSPAERGMALGSLAAMFPQTWGQMSAHMRDWAAESPEGRQMIMALGRGEMTPAEKVKRSDELTTTYVGWGMDPGLARKAADATANGKDVPPEALAAMPKVTPQNMMYTLEAMKALSEAGVPGSELGNATHAFLAGGAKGVMQFLPPKTPTQIAQGIQDKMLQLRQEEVGIQEGHLQVAQQEAADRHAVSLAQAEHWKALAAKLGITASADDMKDMGDLVKIFANIKDPSDSTKALMQQVEDNMAIAMSMDVKKSRSLFGKMKTEYVPNQNLVGGDVTGQPQKGSVAQPSSSAGKPAQLGAGTVDLMGDVTRKTLNRLSGLTAEVE